MHTSIAELYTPDAIARAPSGRIVDVHFDPAQKKKHVIKKRVAAYCRVSTDSDAQLGSLENQMAAFRHQVSLHEDWELVQIYAEMLTTTCTSQQKLDRTSAKTKN